MNTKGIKSNTNREYKDSVFTTLFNTPEKMLELYNAINKTAYTDRSKITVRTLTDVLYKAQKNDIAFTYDDKVVILIEHQSTINKNMPLRLLMYVARTYEEIVQLKPIYHKAIIEIPTPEIIVLYNGKEDYPLETTLKLSDAFKQKQDNYCLNLDVKVININYDKENNLLSECLTLKQYSYFVDKIRKLIDSGYNRDEAIQKSVEDCVNKNILKDFLIKHGTEVCNMLYAEYDIEEALKVREKEGKEEGKLETKIEGVKKALIRGKLTIGEIAEDIDLPLDIVKGIAKKMNINAN